MGVRINLVHAGKQTAMVFQLWIGSINSFMVTYRLCKRTLKRV